MQTLQRYKPSQPVRSLPVAKWPLADRLGWERACRPGKRLSVGGAASHLAAITRTDLARRYGYFLDHLQRTHQLKHNEEPASLVVPDAIEGFIAELKERVSSVTVAGTIYKVRRTAELIAPGKDFAWLAEIEKDLALLARPKDTFGRVVPSEKLVEAGLTLIAEADQSRTRPPVVCALLARNGLMLALLATSPIRARNFAKLEIGRSFVLSDNTWWIVLNDTKSRRPEERPVPAWLTPFIDRYLNLYRPSLLVARDAGGPPKTLAAADPASAELYPYCQSVRALWIGRGGRPLGPDQVAGSICATTRSTLGVEVSPHQFRASAATCAALNADHMPHLASALLQHVDRSVTEEHYNRASSLSVATHYGELVEGIKKEGE